MTNNNHQYQLFTDGGSRGNPGPAAAAYVLYDSQQKIILENSQYLNTQTNNYAEYQALVLALTEMSQKIKTCEINVGVFLDSQLVQRQLTKQYKIKDLILLQLYNQIKQLEKNYLNITYNHVPREQNKYADKLVNECLDQHK